MTVGELKQLIEPLSDDMPIVGYLSDHQYYGVSIVCGTALRQRGKYTQDYGEELTPEADYGTRTHVLIVAALSQ